MPISYEVLGRKCPVGQAQCQHQRESKIPTRPQRCGGRGCTGAETPKSRVAGQESPSQREREVRPTARSSRSREAGKTDPLPRGIPSATLGAGTPEPGCHQAEADVVAAARGRASACRLEWPPRPEISVPVRTVKDDRGQ